MIIVFSKKEKNENDINSDLKNLLRLKKAGFNFPKGIILDYNEFDSTMKINNVDSLIGEKIKSISLDNVNIVSSEILSLLKNIKLDNSLLDNIYDYLKENKKYMVKGYINNENPIYSLNLLCGEYNDINIDDIEKYILNCYLSLYSEEMLTYLLEHNISIENLKISIRIQEMITSNLYGTAYTINPKNGNDKEMLIDVEDSSTNLSSKYIYNWNTKSLTYYEKGEVFTKKEIYEYADILLEIQLYFGYPIRIEFNILNGKLYILHVSKLRVDNYALLCGTWSSRDYLDISDINNNITPLTNSLRLINWNKTITKFINDNNLLETTDSIIFSQIYCGKFYRNISVIKSILSRLSGYNEVEFNLIFKTSDYSNVIRNTGNNILTIVNTQLIKNNFNRYLKNVISNYENNKKNLLENYKNYFSKIENDDLLNVENEWFKFYQDYSYSETLLCNSYFINIFYFYLNKSYISYIDYSSIINEINLYLTDLINAKKHPLKYKYKQLFKIANHVMQYKTIHEDYLNIFKEYNNLFITFTNNYAHYLSDNKVLNDAVDIWYLEIDDLLKYQNGKLNKWELRRIVKKNKDYYYSYKNCYLSDEISFIDKIHSKE